MVFLKSTPDTLQKVVIRKIKKIINQDNGPLFPEKSIVKLNIVNESYVTRRKFNYIFSKAFDYVTMDENAYDLIANQKKNTYNTDSPFVLKLRKNGSTITFQMIKYKNNKDTRPLFEGNSDDSYGYCWR